MISESAMSNPAASFEPYCRRLLGLAYRMLGSMADAEDAVHETYLRWHGADRDKVSDPRAFLMTTATREGPVQTAAFEIEGDVIRALYVMRNSDKLRHLAAASAPHESGRG